jgi:hypothetical protein
VAAVGGAYITRLASTLCLPKPRSRF